MTRITITLALTAAVLGLSGTASSAQSGPPNYSEDQLLSMCRAAWRGTVNQCQCTLKVMHKYMTREHINIYFWNSYDNPSAAKAYISQLLKKDPKAGKKAYNAVHPAWIESQNTCTKLF